ncbi:hypothetical protein AVEN_217809-1, partial [Araneus ventricosus]
GRFLSMRLEIWSKPGDLSVDSSLQWKCFRDLGLVGGGGGWGTNRESGSRRGEGGFLEPIKSDFEGSDRIGI